MSEFIIYWAVKAVGFVVRSLPIKPALAFGRGVGTIVYYLDFRHRRFAYTNLKIAFAGTKTPADIRRLTRETFRNYGQNLIELLRLPLMSPQKFDELVNVEGREHIAAALEEKKGAILLAMHFGSWEMTSLLGASLKHPYNVLVKPQKRFSKLDELLNQYRQCGGSVILQRGMGTRDLIKSLKNNEIVALVVDQGGRDGALVPFFGRQASMSVGAIRIGLKMDVPICFAVIMREKDEHHRLIIHKAIKMVKTGDAERDVETNLLSIIGLMEHYIKASPAEYMWFYKIWKYSKETVAAILTDAKTGHLRQAQAVAGLLQKALKERGVVCQPSEFAVQFRNPFFEKFAAVLSVPANMFGHYGRIGLLRLTLTSQSFSQLLSTHPDFVISAGSSVAPINYLLSQEHGIKSVAIQKPGILNVKHFDLVFLPRHDVGSRKFPEHVIATEGAANLISDEYLTQQKEAFLKRFSHLRLGDNLKIGVFLGGDTKDLTLGEDKIRILLHQIVEAAEEMPAHILLTTSRRTSERTEAFLNKEFRRHPRFKFFLLAGRHNVPEAVGGILGMSDIVVVSGDSISMVCEAASAGKKVIVFPVEHKMGVPFEKTKHGQFVDSLNAKGYILSSGVRDIKRSLYRLVKDKMQTKRLDDSTAILEGIAQII